MKNKYYIDRDSGIIFRIEKNKIYANFLNRKSRWWKTGWEEEDLLVRSHPKIQQVPAKYLKLIGKQP